MRPLSPLELRILGVLVEKQHTVADSYPLSLNTLVLGCNQKTARDPVINTGDAEVLAALDDLKSLDLVIESSGNRVMRYEHNLGRVLRVPSQSLAILAVLMLRGPQTAAELRAATDRLHRFADVSSVEGFLDELAARAGERGGPLVAKLPRGAGTREARWAHLLGGPLPTAGPGDGSVLVGRRDRRGGDRLAQGQSDLSSQRGRPPAFAVAPARCGAGCRVAVMGRRLRRLLPVVAASTAGRESLTITDRDDPALQLDDLLERMQTPGSKTGAAAAFDASPMQLGRAAV